MIDLQLVETGNGGDILLNGNDLAQVMGFENMPYLAMFGGNLAASTPQTRPAGEQAFDWWGNALLMPSLPSQQFNSQTERTLNNVALTSGNLITIQNAVNADIEFMKDFADITITVSIIGVNKIRIDLTIQEPGALSAKIYQYIWDGMAQDLQGNSPSYVVPSSLPVQNGLQYVEQIQL